MKKSYILGAAASLMLASCTSYEIDMPDNPEPPVEGPEVSSSVIYQVNPRFYGTEECLKAVKADIPAIADMGADILWIMPVCEPGSDATSIGSPYSIRDFKAVNSKYGTMADFTDLVDAAHAAGMKVVLDWIANHTSRDHSWITSNPERYAHDADGSISIANGWTDVAQLDYSEPSTGEAMQEAMMYWVENGKIDGFRCDYAEGVPHEFWQAFIAKARASRPDFMMLGETSDADFYDDGFDMIYDWAFSPAVSSAFTGGKVSDIFVKANDSWGKVPEGRQLLRYAFNHDTAAQNNVATYFGSPEGTIGAYVLAAMLHGTPMIYSSMDVDDLSGTLSFFNYRTLTRSASRAAAFKAINKAFRQSAQVRRGSLKTYADNKVAVFTRSIPGHTLLVMVNTSADEQTVKTPITLAGGKMTDLLSGAEVTPDYALTIPAYGYIIYMN